MGAESGEGPGGGRPDAAELALVGGDDAVEEVAGQFGGSAGSTGQDLLGGKRDPPVHPGEDGAHVASVEGGGMEQRSEEGLGPLCPVRVLWTPVAGAVTRPTGGHERLCGGQRPEPGVTALHR